MVHVSSTPFKIQKNRIKVRTACKTQLVKKSTKLEFMANVKVDSLKILSICKSMSAVGFHSVELCILITTGMAYNSQNSN